MRNKILSALFVVFVGGLLVFKSVTDKKPGVITEVCTHEIFLSLLQDGKQIALHPDPLPASHLQLGKRVHKFVQLPQGKTHVSIAVENIARGNMGVVCVAVRTAKGSLMSVPGGLPIDERNEVRDPYEILAAIELKNWPNRACHLKKPGTYFFVQSYTDGQPVDINPRPDDGRPGLVVVYFSADVLTESLDDYLFGPVPSSVLAVLVGEIYGYIPADVP